MDDDRRRLITSAITNMTVAEVRKALAAMRRNWEETMADEHSKPMYMSGEALIRECSVQEFAYRFVLGHHEKRLSKTRSGNTLVGASNSREITEQATAAA
jgi:hypothetical protein